MKNRQRNTKIEKNQKRQSCTMKGLRKKKETKKRKKINIKRKNK